MGWAAASQLGEDAMGIRGESYCTSGGFHPEVVKTSNTHFPQKVSRPAN